MMTEPNGASAGWNYGDITKEKEGRNISAENYLAAWAAQGRWRRRPRRGEGP